MWTQFYNEEQYEKHTVNRIVQGTIVKRVNHLRQKLKNFNTTLYTVF